MSTPDTAELEFPPVVVTKLDLSPLIHVNPWVRRAPLVTDDTREKAMPPEEQARILGEIAALQELRREKPELFTAVDFKSHRKHIPDGGNVTKRKGVRGGVRR